MQRSASAQTAARAEVEKRRQREEERNGNDIIVDNINNNNDILMHEERNNNNNNNNNSNEKGDTEAMSAYENEADEKGPPEVPLRPQRPPGIFHRPQKHHPFLPCKSATIKSELSE